MTNPKPEYKNRDILSNEEIDAMIAEADKIQDAYFRLRAKAVVALAEKFGKRRSEIAALTRKNLRIQDRLLYVTFTLKKKHKRGLHQYLKILEKDNPEALDKPLSMLKLEWKAWTETEEGHSIRQDLRTKSVDVSDRYAKRIVEYMNFIDSKYPSARALCGWEKGSLSAQHTR